jgi:hypothetical protein
MADNIFDAMLGSGVKKEDNGSSIKANAITGKRFMFHSLPKEFQDWQSVYYILEQRAPLDSNTVSRAIYNGIMWQTIGDATRYGLMMVATIIFAIVKLKLSPNIWGLITALLFFMPVLFYTMYHVYFYSFIRSQTLGAVTKAIADNTSYMFYYTFGGIVISLMVAFFFVLYIAIDIAELLAKLAFQGNINGSATESMIGGANDYIISLHNFIADLVNGPNDPIGQIYFNQYITGTILLLITIVGLFVFEKIIYNKQSKKNKQELKLAKAREGYPIDTALETLWEWRRENGI